MPKVTSIRVPDELLAQLDGIARSLDRSRGWVIRRALADYVQGHESGATRAHADVAEGRPTHASGERHRRARAHDPGRGWGTGPQPQPAWRRVVHTLTTCDYTTVS